MRLETNPENKTIEMRGPIGNFDGGISADDFRDCLKDHAGSDVTISLDSQGGSVSDGLAMYNAFKLSAKRVIMTIDGLAASMASVLALAGDVVRMPRNAFLFVHEAWDQCAGSSFCQCGSCR